MNARALMYHDVVLQEDWDGSGFPGSWSRHYKFTRAEFEAHLGAIAAAWDGAPLAAGEPRPGIGSPLRITFDDGGVGALAAAEALEARGWRGYFFITTSRIGTPGFLDPGQLRQLAAAGHTIGSHSETHPTRMAALTTEELRREWTRSVATLEEILGQPARVASVPGGYYSEQVGRTAAEAGIGWLFNSEPVETAGAVAGCQILGRYAIHRGHSAAQAGRFAAGEAWLCWQTRSWWNLKKTLKGANGPAYLALAKRLRR